MFKFLLPFIIFGLLILATACTTYNTELRTNEHNKLEDRTEIRKARVCSNSLFGGFKLPYIGETAVPLSGDQSVIGAIVRGNFNKVYAIDKEKKNYIFFSRDCVIVFGE